MHVDRPTESSSRQAGRLLEADLLRVVAMVSVIVVHSVAWMDLHGPAAGLVYPVLDRTMRFGVPVFVFLTGYVLVHTTRGRPLDLLRFTRRRAVRVVIPFLAWAVIYVAVWFVLGVVELRSPLDFLGLVWHGDVAGHLYFLVVACEFYVLYALLPRSRRASLGLLAVAVPFQLALTTVRASGWVPPAPLDVTFGYQAQWFFPWWIGYYALGAAAAWHRDQVTRLLAAHRLAVAAALLAAVPLTLLDTAWSGATGYDLILRPSTFVLSAAVIAVVASLAAHAAQAAAALRSEVEVLAQRSLGVYLVHPLVLLAAGRLVQNAHLPLSFEGPLGLTLPTLLIVVGAVLLASLVLVQGLSHLPGGWALAGREEARGRPRQPQRAAPRAASA